MAKQCVMTSGGCASAVEGQKMALIGSVLTQAPITGKDMMQTPSHQVINVNGVPMDCYVRTSQPHLHHIATQPIVYTGTIEGPKTYTQSQTHFEVVTQLKPKYVVHTTTAAAPSAQLETPVLQNEAITAVTDSIRAVEVPQQQQQVNLSVPAVQMVVPQTAVAAPQVTYQQAPQYGYQQLITNAAPQAVTESVSPRSFMAQSWLRPDASAVTTQATYAAPAAATFVAPMGSAVAAPMATAFAVPTFQSVGADASMIPLHTLCQQYCDQMRSTNASFNPITFTREMMAMNDEELQQWLGQRGFFDNPTQYVMGPKAVRAAILKFVERGGVPDFQVVYTPKTVENLLDFYADVEGDDETTETAATTPAAAAATPSASAEAPPQDELVSLLTKLAGGQ